MKPKSVVFAITVAMIASAAFGEPYRVGALAIQLSWSRATPKSATVAVGYLQIRNTGTVPDRLVGGSVAIARRVEIHEMSVDGGVMKMREVKNGLEIKPGETVELSPGGSHLMFNGLTQPVEQGKPIRGTLVFEKAGTDEIEYAVKAIGARS